jgi:hypothetical protein
MRVRTSVLVQRPIDVVFERLTSADEKLSFEYLSPSGGSPTTWEVTAYEPPMRLALRQFDEVGGGLEMRWTLERLPSGATCVWVEADLTPSGLLPPRSIDLAEIGRRQVQHDLEILSRRLEAENPTV